LDLRQGGKHRAYLRRRHASDEAVIANALEVARREVCAHRKKSLFGLARRPEIYEHMPAGPHSVFHPKSNHVASAI
jgi:hypothetical protein